MTHEATRAESDGTRTSFRLSASWLVAVTLRRTRAQWRLLIAVVSVAVLSSTLIVSLGLLVTATEQGGVRGALAAVPSTQSMLEVRILSPHGAIANSRANATKAIETVLGPAATATSAGIALSKLSDVPALSTPQLPALAYFGEIDDIESHATLSAGVWARRAAPGSPIQVALPAAAAKRLALAVGDTVTVNAGSAPVTVKIVGLYAAKAPQGHYWSRDTLSGAGSDPAFPKPGVSFYVPTNAFGPLVMASGGLAAGSIPASFLDIEYLPHFDRATVDELGPLQHRLASVDNIVTSHIGTSAGGVYVASAVADAVGAVATGLAVTRSTVVVVSLLLVVLAIAAMAQTARLFTDARAGERRLMSSRGASRAHILGLATLEAGLIGAVTVVASPLLAMLVYRFLAALPPMVAAGMPAEAGLPAFSWARAGAIALVLVGVLVAPLLRRSRTFVEGEQAKGRQGAASGMMRSGLDLVLVVLAAVAFWQLQQYRSPVSADGSLTVDPVLAAGPALVLVAATLVCMRLIPAASRLIERLGARTRGIGVSLAAWEIGRRAQRATAAVLLLSLTLAVGVFGISFLSTWRQAQVDQASLAVGPPVRVPAVVGAASTQESELAHGAVKQPQPVIRRSGHLVSGDDSQTDASGGAPAQILALTPSARRLLDRGRLSDEGGSSIMSGLSSTAKASGGVKLPGDVRGVTATVQIGDEANALPGVAAEVSAMVENAEGLLSTIGLGRVPVDGRAHEVRGLMPRAPGDTQATRGVRIVGLQASVGVVTPESYRAAATPVAANILVGGLAVLHPDPAQQKAEAGDDPVDPTFVSEPVSVPAGVQWHALSTEDPRSQASAPSVPHGWQLSVPAVIPRTIDSAPQSYAVVGWMPELTVPAVVTDALAERLNISSGTLMSLRIQGVSVTVSVAGTTPLVPGAAGAADLSAVSSAAVSPSDTVVLDQSLLARALAEAGVTGAMVDEWWVDVPAGTAQAYLDALHLPAGSAPAVSAETLALQLQQSPLRVATQAALWLAILASALLAAIGFAVHSTATLRARRLELAQLRALGFSRRGLVGLVATESALMCLLGTVFGVAIGLLLVVLVGPLVAVSPSGVAPVPAVVVRVEWPGIALLVATVAVVLALVVLFVARVQRFVEPAELLRAGGEP